MIDTRGRPLRQRGNRADLDQMEPRYWCTLPGLGCPITRHSADLNWLQNPMQAANGFATRLPEFVLKEPQWRLDEIELDRIISGRPGA
jgi:hypothetical protein